MGFLTKVKLKKQLQQLGIKVEGNYIRKSYIKRVADQNRKVSLASKFKEHPDVEFPKELKDMGFKDLSWHNDETGLAVKKLSPKQYAGIWVWNEDDKTTDHRFFVIKAPADEDGEFASDMAEDVGGADTLDEVKVLLQRV